jgi:hypothetical protein
MSIRGSPTDRSGCRDPSPPVPFTNCSHSRSAGRTDSGISPSSESFDDPTRSLMRSCENCGAALGPGERYRSCLTCRFGSFGTLADCAVAILEKEETALPTWDITRQVNHDHYRYRASADANTLGHRLRWDARICWGGRAVYGLYRHGLLPGAQDLGTAAAIYLFVSNTSLHYEKLWFATKNSGYSASPVSLYYGLRRAEAQHLVERSRDGDWRRRPRELVSEGDIADMLGATRRETRRILERTRAQLDNGLDVSRKRRMGVAES